MQEKLAPSFCRKSGKYPGGKKKCSWVRWILPITGLPAFVWFLVRVVPKPSRAMYPCQRVAMPLASGFVVWLVGLVVSVTAFKKAKQLLKESRVTLACLCLIIGGVMGIVSLTNLPERLANAQGRWGPHGPIGEARGIYPGRVVWAWNPNATDWEGYSSPEHWYDNDHTDPAVVEKMVSQAIRELSGKSTDAIAWDAIF